MKIVFLEPIGMKPQVIEEACAPILTPEDQLVVYIDRVEDENTLIERAQGANIVVESNIPLSARFFDSVPTLQLLSIAFAGIDHIDAKACNQHGVKIMNAAGYSTHAVAELAIGLAIAQLRRIVNMDGYTREGSDKHGFLGTQLQGKVVGIIGLGAIGRQVASLANAFGCRVIAYNRTLRQVENVEQVSLERLLMEADIITLHVPLTAETRGMISNKEFSMMKSNAILINTARGAVVDKNALYQALSADVIAGAAIDVFDQEPPLDKTNPLFSLQNITLTPHIGYATKEAFKTRLAMMVENIRVFKAAQRK